MKAAQVVDTLGIAFRGGILSKGVRAGHELTIAQLIINAAPAD